MQYFQLINYIVRAISLVGLVIILWGILDVVKDFLFTCLTDDAQKNRHLRQKLGSYLILGLEFFIAADIIRTIIQPGWNEIGMLGAIILLRTVLSFFLGLELREKD
ncbi:MAG: DUF1622 domain-containing protein [bacterium]